MIQTTATITDQELMELSSQNPELRFERNADGTLVTMTPSSFSLSSRWFHYNLSPRCNFKWRKCNSWVYFSVKNFTRVRHRKDVYRHPD